MGKIFEIVKREGSHGLDFIVESRVTGEVFLLIVESRDPDFPLVGEIRRMINHIFEVRRWVKDGVIKFSGKQVVYCKVYC